MQQRRVKDFHNTGWWSVWSCAVVALGTWCVLALAYNSYKEYATATGEGAIFPLYLKVAIKSTFPWVVLIVTVLYLLNRLFGSRLNERLGVMRHGVTVVAYAVVVNGVFYRMAPEVIVVANISVLYFVLMLLLRGGVKRLTGESPSQWLESLLPTFLYGLVKACAGLVKKYTTGRYSSSFIILFIALLPVCALLLIFKGSEATEGVASVAYLALVAGVVKEVYGMVKGADKDEAK